LLLLVLAAGARSRGGACARPDLCLGELGADEQAGADEPAGSTSAGASPAASHNAMIVTTFGVMHRKYGGFSSPKVGADYRHVPRAGSNGRGNEVTDSPC